MNYFFLSSPKDYPLDDLACDMYKKFSLTPYAYKSNPEFEDRAYKIRIPAKFKQIEKYIKINHPKVQIINTFDKNIFEMQT